MANLVVRRQKELESGIMNESKAAKAMKPMKSPQRTKTYPISEMSASK